MRTDYNCFVGQWPFVKRRNIDFEGLRLLHEKHGIESGMVSIIGAAFANDPHEYDAELSRIIKGSSYRHAVSINPKLPNVSYDIARADESFEYDAFRVYPTLHGYELDSPEFRRFCHMAEKKHKPVIIHCTFGDPRLDYLIKQKQLDFSSVSSFVMKKPDIPIVLCNIRLSEINQIDKAIRMSEDTYVDMSELRHSMFVLEDLENAGLAGRIVFGSFYPMFDFLAAYIHFDGSDLQEDILTREIKIQR